MALEYSFTKQYPYEFFDHPDIDDALVKIAEAINFKGVEYARRVFDKFCENIREAVINPEKKNRVWGSVLRLAYEMTEE